MPRLTSFVLLAALVLVGCAGTSPSTPEAASTVLPDVTLASPGTAPAIPQLVADVRVQAVVLVDGLQAPVMALPRPGTADLWVAQQNGEILALDQDGEVVRVVDLRDLVAFGGERGLLGLAFAPDHATSGIFYVHYSAADDGATTLQRWTATSDLAQAGEVLLRVAQPASNHNGGMIQFGPDGMLFVALGDGGAANDQFGNGQRPDTLLGTILRLDVSGASYAIPADNPFVDGTTPDGAAAAPEVWAYGLRNPWRTWIDDDRIWIGDVGQGNIEEIDVLPLSDAGKNLGWPIMEGSTCFVQDGCARDGLVAPVAEYDHSDNACSITGGVVNRGPLAPDLHGHWFYADFCAGFVRSLRLDDDGQAIDQMDWTERLGGRTPVLSFGTDHDGNVLILGADGTIRRIEQTN